MKYLGFIRIIPKFNDIYTSSVYSLSGNIKPLKPTHIIPIRTQIHPLISIFEYILFKIILESTADVTIIPLVTI